MSGRGTSSSKSARLMLRTAAWYGDRLLDLELPNSWDASIFTPRTGGAMTDEEIRQRLESPVNQRPVRERCSATTRPLIIVDDLNRPTPAARVLTALVQQFTDAGIPRRNITIIVGSGTHAPPSAAAVAKKVGEELVGSCRICIHDPHRDLVKVGRTSFGTPVLLSKEATTSTFVVGIGGLYPNHTGGFGGGSKAALGILGFRSIAALHFGHESVGWGADRSRDTFRQDLDEIAQFIHLETGVFVCVDANREIVDLTCGDVRELRGSFLASTKDMFRAAAPDQDDRVVISNAYPSDLSLTFVRMKGTVPLASAPSGASKVVVASCSEGLGYHGLFPFMNAPRFHRQRMLRLRVSANLTKPRRLVTKGAARLMRAVPTPRARGPHASDESGHPTWLYCPSPEALAMLPSSIPGFRATSSWSEVVEGVAEEQRHESPLRTSVYAAAPLQWLG
jgi:nickel-dependent lactate racemase